MLCDHLCMRGRQFLCVLFGAGLLFGIQTGDRGRRWAHYEAEMQNPADDPPGAWDEAEFAFARLRYRSFRDGWRGARWGIDANTSDRHFITALRRLTRVDARSVEEIVDIESDDIYKWPWLYAVGIGDWRLSESHARRLKEYFARGGFFTVDDFHNEREWASFMVGLNQCLPGNVVEELEIEEPIFHLVYDLKRLTEIPGLNVVHAGLWERGGVGQHYRAVLDHKRRIQVGIWFNMDLGDAWEWADNPEYPEVYASQAFRVGVNYVVYAMTH